eukprot:3611074-Rhodomonas_salina.2
MAIDLSLAMAIQVSLAIIDRPWPPTWQPRAAPLPAELAAASSRLRTTLAHISAGHRVGCTGHCVARA